VKIQLVSDVHLEFGHKVVLDNAGADVLVLAGDICSARHLVKPDDEFMPLPIERKNALNFFKDCSEKFNHVVYIMGNHEHYKHTFNDTAKVLRECLFGLPNIHFLDNEDVVLDDVKFIGATLWTDNNKGCPVTENKLQFGMNDFRLIKYKDDKGNYFKFDPRLAAREHLQSKKRIGIATFSDLPCVVVTHHAPSFKSIHPMYANDTYMNGGYASDLEYLMGDNVKLWVHGHTHKPFDYEVNGTRVVCNPRGYPGERPNYTDIVLEV
jgi:predicted phosphodiesterase